MINRRSFMQALGASLGFFGLGKFAEAKPDNKFRYNEFFRRCDQATMDEFMNIVYLDDYAASFNVPIIWATEDKAEAYVNHVVYPDKKINTIVNLPVINLYRGDLFFNDKIHCYYHATIRTMYQDHMNQILEQVITKFHPTLKNEIGEYSLLSMINNYYPGGSRASMYPMAENMPMRGEQYSAVKYGQTGEWMYYKPENSRVLKHQLNMIVAMEGKP